MVGGVGQGWREAGGRREAGGEGAPLGMCTAHHLQVPVDQPGCHAMPCIFPPCAACLPSSACRQLPCEPAGAAAAPGGRGGSQCSAGRHNEQRGHCCGRLRSLPRRQRRCSGGGCQAAAAAAQPNEEAHRQPDSGGRWPAALGAHGWAAAAVRQHLAHPRRASQQCIAGQQTTACSWMQPIGGGAERDAGAGCQPRPAAGPAQLAAGVCAQWVTSEVTCDAYTTQIQVVTNRA